jgi:hypothetical protein
MRKSQACLLAALACVMALAVGCSSMEPRSGSQADQQREHDNEPSGMKGGGGGGGGY